MEDIVKTRETLNKSFWLDSRAIVNRGKKLIRIFSRRCSHN